MWTNWKHVVIIISITINIIIANVIFIDTKKAQAQVNTYRKGAPSVSISAVRKIVIYHIVITERFKSLSCNTSYYKIMT